MGLFDFIKKKTKNKAVFCGLDSSGKSTYISFIKTGTFVPHTPTMGKKLEHIEINGTKITLFDMGGQADFRDLWLGEINNAKCVIFLIDKSDKARFKEVRTELNKILPTIEKNNISLLFLANKHDRDDAVSISELIRELNLFEVKNFEILEISAKTGYGMADSIAKFYSLLTERPVEKPVFAKAVSLYESDGAPILLKIADPEVNEAIKEGFNEVIKSVGKVEIQSNEMQIIPRKTNSTGVFIIGCSPHFIGSILWDETLAPITVEQSEESLKSLLFHLEKVDDLSNKELIKKFAEGFVTNLL